MAFRVEKRTLSGIAALLAAPALFAQQSLQYEALHAHSRPPHIRKAGCRGTLTIGETGVSFQQNDSKHPHAWRWDYQDIQELTISPRSITVLTYKDNRWEFGADRQYQFDLLSGGKTFADAYLLFRRRLDQRLVAALAATPRDLLWELPVKHLAAFSGDEGVLQVGSADIIYKSDKPGESRTWRYQDIDNISTSGPFQITITTFERARLDYGSRKQFDFALKQPLAEDRYNDLWLRLNESKGLHILTSYRQQGPAR